LLLLLGFEKWVIFLLNYLLDQFEHVGLVDERSREGVRVRAGVTRGNELIEDTGSSDLKVFRVLVATLVNDSESLDERKRDLLENFGNFELSRLLSGHEESQFTRVTLHLLTEARVGSDKVIGQPRDEMLLKSLQSFLVVQDKFTQPLSIFFSKLRGQEILHLVLLRRFTGLAVGVVLNVSIA